ncbi:MAG: folate-binding protein, partial [Gammaproteobacteria bacterium]|nr:folate-binding protein [Gammaproteobacteria bacterium]
LRAKVTLTNRSDTALRIGLSGSDAERQLAPLINPLPHAVDSAVSASSLTVVRIHPALYPRFLLLIDDIEQAKEVWGHLDVQATAVGHAPWELLNIRAGIPAVFSATQEAFIPQMVNLQAINGLSFNKGCYPGQEVVARMEYLGQLKRTMYHITTPATCSPHAGDTLYAASSSSAQGAGKIISIEMNGDGGWEGLAVVEVTAAESNDLTLDQEGTIKLTVQAPKTA